MDYSVVIVAAGKGSRMNVGYNKVYMPIEDNKTILEKTMEVFDSDPECTQIILVTEVRDYQKYVDGDYHGKIVFAKGGETRQDSVLNGLAAVVNDVVLIHDGARPYLSKENLQDVKNAMIDHKACCLMVPCIDTVAIVRDDFIVEPLKREELMMAQTPQAFNRELIFTCLCKAKKDGFVGTDDASVVMKYSDEKVFVVKGDYHNIKITTAKDIQIQK